MHKRKYSKVLFVLYLISLFWLIIFKGSLKFEEFGSMRSINLIPFSQPLVINGRANLYEIIMNVIIFMPLGIYAGLLYRKWRFWKKICLFFLISLVCELSQFILGIGASDITDIINNTLGGILGLIVFIIFDKVFTDEDKTQKIINILATGVTILMIAFLVVVSR